jgi:membrane protease YdiL (CAAX protease family)
MSPKRLRKVQTLSFAAALVGWSFVAPKVRWHPVPNAALGTGLAIVTRARLGLRPPALWPGLRYGAAAAACVGLGVAASTALPRVRAEMSERELPDATARWLLWAIPVGTVWPEEVAYRAVLGAAAEEAFGPTVGRLVQATAFGLWHIVDARVTKQPVLREVLATGVAGWAFGWLHGRSGSLAAPMLAHMAVNEVAGVAALVVQRRATRRACPSSADAAR